jgi:hypothetical protein
MDLVVQLLLEHVLMVQYLETMAQRHVEQRDLGHVMDQIVEQMQVVVLQMRHVNTLSRSMEMVELDILLQVKM